MADLDDVRRLVAADQGLAVVATTRADGSVHASVVNAGVLDREGAEPVVAFVSRGDATKVRLLRARPRAAVVFRADWEWVAAEGPVTIIDPDGTDPEELRLLLREVFAAAGGTHDDWDEYDRVMKSEGRAAVLVEPARITSN
jgi:PPOX class probable F420-dependent enzyme